MTHPGGGSGGSGPGGGGGTGPGREVQTFQFGDLPLRTVTVGGEPWFVTADALAPLDLNRSSLAALDDDEKGVHSVYTPGGYQQMSVISEAGLYSLILRSRKPEAKAFKRWITHEVLPTLRRTGRYEAAQVSRRELAQMVIEEADRADRAEARVAELAPKAEAHEVFESADGTYSFEQVAKMLHAETGLGRNNLIKRLRHLSVLTDKNLPYQRYAHHFHVVASSFEHTDGRREITYTTRVRATGVDFIRRKVGAGQAVTVSGTWQVAGT